MSWALPWVAQLAEGTTVKFRPRGNSMAGKIDSGQLVTVEPITEAVRIGDIVLCKVAGSYYLHLVKAYDAKADRFQIGNNKGRINGWTPRKNLFGKVIEVAD